MLSAQVPLATCENRLKPSSVMKISLKWMKMLVKHQHNLCRFQCDFISKNRDSTGKKQGFSVNSKRMLHFPLWGLRCLSLWYVFVLADKRIQSMIEPYRPNLWGLNSWTNDVSILQNLHQAANQAKRAHVFMTNTIYIRLSSLQATSWAYCSTQLTTCVPIEKQLDMIRFLLCRHSRFDARRINS